MNNHPLNWFRKARFGMFIHWGIYSALEGVWQGKEAPSLGEWIQCTLRIPGQEYREFAKGLTLEKFDADQWVKLARDAGMRYIIFTAKHHDGFAMYGSKHPYNIVSMSPSGRDPLKELAEATRRHGLKLGVYYSQSHDWEDPNAQGNTWDYPADNKDFKGYLKHKCHEQLIELLTNYGEISVVWFDVPVGVTAEYAAMLKSWVRALQPSALISGRISGEPGFNDYGSFGDNQLPIGKLTGDWETAATLNHTWGYKRNDRDWKTAGMLIDSLVQLAGLGANYLLNIGPRADGSIPEQSIALLKEVGAWMKCNGEAVYGTSTSPFPCGFPWGICTAKDHALYFILLKPRRKIEVNGLKTAVRQAEVLGRDIPVKLVCGNEFFSVEFDEELPKHSVIKLLLEGTAECNPMPVQQPDGTVVLPAYLAELHLAKRNGEHAGQEYSDAAQAAEKAGVTGIMSVDFSGAIVNWNNTANHIEWEFELKEPGCYQLELRSFAPKYKKWQGGHRMRCSIGEKQLESSLKADSKPQTPNAVCFDETGSILGNITLAEPAIYRLKLELTEIAAPVMPPVIAELHLTRIKS